MKQIELASKMGVSQGNLSNWENGNYEPDYATLSKLCEIFDCSADYLLGRDNAPRFGNVTPANPDRNITLINVYGKIPAGTPVELWEDITGEEEIPADWVRGGQSYFGIVCSGRSMMPEFKDGDTLIFRATQQCESGQFCAVTVGGTETTFKKVVFKNNTLILQPLNTVEFDATVFTREQAEEMPVQVIGVLKEVRRSFG